MTDGVLVAREGQILAITLNRPDACNAVTRAVSEVIAATGRRAGTGMSVELMTHLVEWAVDDRRRALNAAAGIGGRVERDQLAGRHDVLAGFVDGESVLASQPAVVGVVKPVTYGLLRDQCWLPWTLTSTSLRCNTVE